MNNSDYKKQVDATVGIIKQEASSLYKQIVLISVFFWSNGLLSIKVKPDYLTESSLYFLLFGYVSIAFCIILVSFIRLNNIEAATNVLKGKCNQSKKISKINKNICKICVISFSIGVILFMIAEIMFIIEKYL